MNPSERMPLLCGHLSALLAVLGVLALAVLGASTVTVCLFVAGIFGVVGSTAALAQAENATQQPAHRTG